MSIVGAEAVSLSDLMKLGPQALGAMAQGQTKSIAPSYMVLAALKALTEQQQGMAPNAPQGTVKDQLVAQATPPQQAGIGAMAPQKFAEGGQVLPIYAGAFSNEVPEETEARGAGLRQRFFDWLSGKNTVYDFSKKEEVPLPVLPTVATPSKGTAPAEEESPAPVAQPNTGNRFDVTASSTARSGIAGAGVSPTAKYAKNNVKAKPLSEIEGLDIPEDKFLNSAIDKFSKPDEKRMAELKEDERNAGLGAFAKGILKGRGFGGAFGPAVAESFEAQKDAAKERRAYEDAREKMALELGLKKGSREYENFFKNVEFKKGERDADLRQQTDARDYQFLVEKTLQDDKFKAAELALRGQANAIAERVRVEGMDQRKFDNLFRIQQMAYQTAQEVAAKMRSDPLMMAMPEAQRERAIADATEQAYRRTFPKDVEAVMRNSIGLPGAPAVGGGSGRVLGEMKR